MDNLTDCAQGYCEMYCKKYGHCFGDPGDCIFKDEVKMYEKLKSIEGIITFDRLLELAVSDKAGQIIILPCKVGDTVYRVIRTKDGGGHIARAVVSGIHMADTVRGYRYQKGTEYVVLRVDGYYCDHVDVKKFGKTVFLDREEAEAALKGGEK